MTASSRIPPWAMNAIRAEGSAVAPPERAGTPQGQLLAARAAELVAKRNLAEQIHGLSITSETLVRDFVAEHDEIGTHVDAVLVGATVEDTTFDGDTARVVVSIPGMQVWEILHERIRVTRMSSG